MKLLNRLLRWRKASDEEHSPTTPEQALSVIALGHTDADTAHVLDPSVDFDPEWALKREDVADRRLFTYSGPRARPLSILDLGASQPSQRQLSTATALIFVADLEPYDQPGPPPALNHIQSVLARLAAVRSSAPDLPLFLLLRNTGPFRRKLDEVPLESCFPGEDCTLRGDELEGAPGVKLLIRKLNETNPGSGPDEDTFYLNFMAREATVTNMTFIILVISDMAQSR
ncbi:hypothetical protein MCOR27_001151 [Pyricularia oryzae]|uniref:Uncharacterized protein n=3 Tax=Pyricularia TaxID=48558 RepID=A0ABQ8NZS7_PYRGI|nr:uncharacterized protein MGG_09447 [Pyricularia oryzae 70-15]KAH8846267.1 hypothetical protein MCOR01_003468 [Pyricularia oryzae]KAI6304481.1 hypothetical protein MCOR33_000573 [Pyricularia grisea]EHA47787.1 hypothetical protein MGG_09447 [Pyricularia oryzae 70-15]KAH9432223.1 hypothetical protein MCOR02_006928 [Pyricularia oryzae]KAI6253101.1 hypothetical protein MCOR19_010319 [Pyricularia oryzae]